jgi:hypothetical protein
MNDKSQKTNSTRGRGAEPFRRRPQQRLLAEKKFLHGNRQRKMATLATESKPIYSEQGRHTKKRLELQKKLAQRNKQEATAVTQEEVQKTAKLAKEAADKIIADQNGEGKEQPRPKIKIGKKSLVTTEVVLTKREQARIQAKCAAGHAAKILAEVKQEKVVKTFDDTNLQDDHVLVFTGCVGCTYTVNSRCVKIFVEKCTQCTFHFNGKIITAVVEVDRCEESNLLIGTDVGTLQVEQCKRMNVVFAEKALMTGYIIWAGCFTLRVQVGDDLMRCDFELTKGFDNTVNVERTQFKIHYNTLGKLVCDKIIRLKNGFPTTKMEDDEFQRKHEQTIKLMADRMGITIHKKSDTTKTKPNAKCPCGSGKKYKKCCRHGRVDTKALVSDPAKEAELARVKAAAIAATAAIDQERSALKKE